MTHILKTFFDKYRKEKQNNLYPMFLELPLEKGKYRKQNPGCEREYKKINRY